MKTNVYTGKVYKRVFIALDCYIPIERDERSRDWVTLENYLMSNDYEISEANIFRIMFKLSDALARMHEKNLIHWNINKKNIFINRRTSNIQLGGFSQSFSLDEGHNATNNQ